MWLEKDLTVTFENVTGLREIEKFRMWKTNIEGYSHDNICVFNYLVYCRNHISHSPSYRINGLVNSKPVDNQTKSLNINWKN